MKKLRIIAGILFISILAGCSEDPDTGFVDALGAPGSLTATVTSAPDNINLVTITPKADGIVKYDVYFGDDTAEPAEVAVAGSVTHTYVGGDYTIKVVAFGINGKTSEIEIPLSIPIPPTPVNLPVTFQRDLNYVLTDFNGTTSSIVDNPDVSGINLSSKVVKVVKNAGADTFAGSFITLSDPIDFSTQHQIRVKVWSPQAGITIKLKIENLTDGNTNKEVDKVSSVANGWEYLTYDFSAADLSKEYSKVTIFFDFGNPGNGSTFYFDDIYLTNGTTPKILPLTFESNINYGFGDFGNAFASRVSNPDPTGINTSAHVAKVVKNAGSEVWAGTAITLTEPIDFSVYQKVKVKVWSPQAGIIVLCKFENSGDTSITTEVQATTTISNGWEELTYDFTGINNDNSYQNVVLFFDFNNVGTGATYYFDDVQLSN